MMNIKHCLRGICAALLTAGMLTAATTARAEGGSFEVGNKTFLLNGKPFVVKAAEVHYPRIPEPYWEQRIKMCKALGMNTLCIYIFWNIHEQQEGVFDFTGNNDIRKFVQLAQKNGMYVIVRPGPYVCAEWEMGGLPWWLLKKKDIRLREQDPYFMERLRIFEKEVGKQLGDLTIEKGGPIIMVQVENEYGSYGEDKAYIAEVRDIIRESGFDKVELFQCDWSSNFTKNGLDDLTWTMNFGTGANIDNEFRRLGELRPNSPKMCSEFWSGWFDKWGGNHETRGAKDMVDGMKQMLDRGISFSLYMTHGGTNWGHWAGANSPGYAPDVTSYDYDAPINEAGQTTPKYWELRKMMENYDENGHPMPQGKKAKLPAVPKEIPVITIPKIQLTEFAPLMYANTGHNTDGNNGDFTWEAHNFGFGQCVYNFYAPNDIETESVLNLEAHDYAQVFVGEKFIGTIDRIKNEKSITLPPMKKTDRITVIVEALGRINFGRAIKDFKGIVGDVTISAKGEWHDVTYKCNRSEYWFIDDKYETALLALDRIKKSPSENEYMENFTSDIKMMGSRGYYRGYFDLKKVGDTFLNFETWGKGQVYVNGHAIGRIWQIGPQQTLYMPGCWLKKGRNEIIVLDLVGPKEAVVEGLSKPIIDKLQISGPQTHRLQGQTIDLSGEKPVNTGTLKPGNGWQEVKFDKTVSGRYVCIEALNSHRGAEYCCIAELYLLNENGQRLSRDSWQVAYADDEDVQTGNKAGDKAFDLQESTYWSTNQGVQFPHHLVIDLGQDKQISGFQILPRMEQGAPESIKDYRIYVKSDLFKGL